MIGDRAPSGPCLIYKAVLEVHNKIPDILVYLWSVQTVPQANS